MKLFLTGTSGYLGRYVLDLVVQDERIKKIWVTSRTKKRHPHPKVEVLNVDLSDPVSLSELGDDFDAVIHLAGLYDFQESYGNCYTNNVLPTQHIIKKLKLMNRERRVPLYVASTYAVNSHHKQSSYSEKALESLPSTSIPYAFTKAVAERIVTDSDVPSAVFRLGILVGRSTDGAVEKPDGAYSFLNWLSALSKNPLFKGLPGPLQVLPLPGDPKGLLPLVPVDIAAQVFHRALFMPECAGTPAKVYGVYNEESVRIKEFCDQIIERFSPASRGVFVRKVPARLLKMVPQLLNVSVDALHFSLNPIELHNPGFQALFGQNSVPAFKQYQDEFFAGFSRHRGGAI